MFNSRTSFGPDRDAFIVSTVDHDNDTFRTTWWHWDGKEAGEIHETAIADGVGVAISNHAAACVEVLVFKVGE